jgi:tetratricopeptide (TPR) repeat protein
VYTRGERAFLIDRVITPCLDVETDLQDDHLRAQLLFFRAAMWAQLYQFDRAREDYKEANRILEVLIASPECQPVDYQTWARVRLGFGRLAVEQAGQPVTNDPAVQDPRDDRSLRGKPALELAMRYFHEALEAARRYGDDQILETNIQSELSLTAALLGEREQALQAYQTALAILSREEIRLRGADPEAWVYCRARVLETAGMVHWQLAENPDTCAGDPQAEYRLAYDLASEEIQLLEAESVQISDVLAVAHFNAGDFLQASAEYEPWEREEHIKAARRHWQAALDLSLKLGVEDVIEQAAVRLRETAPAAGLREK